MHPAPFEASTDSSGPSSLASTPSISQYGRLHDHIPTSVPSSPGADAAGDGSTSEWSLSSTGSGSPSEGYDTWLSPSRWDAHQPTDPEVEEASSLDEKYNADSQSSEDVSPLQLIPEELMFHIISHLSAPDLLTVKLVSRRFYNLVNSPHAWMDAFSRFFPGPESLRATADLSQLPFDQGVQRSEQRAFARLTSTTSWSGEYLRRTKLLRCLVRGKPALPFACPAPGRPDKGMATFTFSSRLGLETSNLHADWGQKMDKRKPQFISGCAGSGKVTSSDRKGKFDSWGITDRNLFRSFVAEHPGSVPYGRSNETIVGLPNMMDLSQAHGMIYAEGTPGGNTFFLGHDEKRGRNLASFSNSDKWDIGMPGIDHARQCTCSVWIAKTSAVPRVSGGMIGMLSGSSSGIVSAYSLGPAAKRDQRLERGELTARWLLSPGVPIIALAFDEDLNDGRFTNKRILAVALNALGELFYLAELPTQNFGSKRPHELSSVDELSIHREECAWRAGATCNWRLVSRSARAVKQDLTFDQDAPSFLSHQFWAYKDHDRAGSLKELHDLKYWLKATPALLQSNFDGWNMQRRLEVDFGGDDNRGAGEHIVVINPSPTATDSMKGQHSTLTRYSRCNLAQWGDGKPVYEWRESSFSFSKYQAVTINVTALDQSLYATTTEAEDLILGKSRDAKDVAHTSENCVQAQKMPGQRARLFAAGSAAGTIFVWNVRSATSGSAALIHSIEPIRIIHTQSPGITALAVSSLLLVHGGAEGLIQAWDPLGSTLEPLRTLTSQRSINNRRRLVIAARQNPEMHLGWTGAAHFAATNICLDPDATVLRGVAAVGGFLRYWSYSSASPSDELSKAEKRKLKRGNRSYNPTPGENFVGIRRVGLKGFVNQELRLREMERKEDKAYEKEQRRVAGRFGLNLLGNDASDEELLAYAKLLSQEEDQRRALRESQERLEIDATPEFLEAHLSTLSPEEQQKWKFASWEERRETFLSSSRASPFLMAERASTSSGENELARALDLSLQEDALHTPRAATPEASTSKHTEFEDADMAEAIRLSLAVDNKQSPSPTSSVQMSHLASPSHTSITALAEEDDLERAIRLSLEESGLPVTPETSMSSPSLSASVERRTSVPLDDNAEFPSLGASSPASGFSSSGENRALADSPWGKGKRKI